MIIDCHVHLNYYGFEQKCTTLEERLKALLENMIKNRIDYSLILSSYEITSNRPSTSKILEITKEYDNLGVIAGLTIDNHTEKDFEDCRKWLKNGLIKGIKLYCGYEYHFPYDKRYQRIYDLCLEFGVPVMIHAGDTFSNKGKLRYSHPLNLDEVAVENPGLKIVICHLGNPWILDCQELLYKNKNIYADISGLVFGNFTPTAEKRYADEINRLVSYVGKGNQLLYGTDWPISNMESYFNFVSKLRLTHTSRDLLMSKNAMNIFNIYL
jgi:uncharacterized protein